MERYRMSSASNGIPPPPPPPPTQRAADFFSNPPSQISLPPKPHLRDPPISPYLHPPRPNPAGDSLRNASEDSEISIFDAERYFKEGQQDPNDTSKKLPAIAERHDLSPKQPDTSSLPISSLDGLGRNCRSRSFHATPTASSEASWNSQTGLLRNPPGSLSVSVRSFPLGEQRKGTSSSSSGRRRRCCPCSGRKSVDVEENYSDPKTPVRSSFDVTNSSAVKKHSLKTGEEEVEPAMTKVKVFPGIWPKEKEAFRFSPEIGRRIVTSGGFSFPVLAPPKEEAAEDPARDSLEVFRPSDGTASPAPMRKSTDFQKRPTSLLDGGDRRSFTFPGSPKLRSAVDDDLASDTSSDLFEIESLSTQITCRWRDSLDEFEPKKISGSGGGGPGILQLRRSVEEESVAPSIAPSECYAPSEVSVQWSVTTAEGFDRASVANFSSAVSEYEELRYAAEAAAAAGEGRRKGIGGGGLLSCRSEKAVNVAAPNLLRFGPETQRRTGASVFAIEPDRVLGVARMGAANPVRDGTGLSGSRSVRTSQTIPPINARIY